MHAMHLTTCISLTSQVSMNVGINPIKVSRYIQYIGSYLAINEGL